jgi:hypothetical protein
VNGACSTHKRNEICLQCSQNRKRRDVLGSLVHSWKDNINMEMKALGCEDVDWRYGSDPVLLNFVFLVFLVITMDYEVYCAVFSILSLKSKYSCWPFVVKYDLNPSFRVRDKFAQPYKTASILSYSVAHLKTHPRT